MIFWIPARACIVLVDNKDESRGLIEVKTCKFHILVLALLFYIVRRPLIGGEVVFGEDSCPRVLGRLGISALEVEADSILVGLVERRTNVLTDVLKDLDVTLSTARHIVLELILVVLVKDLGRVSRLVIDECGALSELGGSSRDTCYTTHVMDNGEIVVALSVKRHRKNTETAVGLHCLILSILKRTEKGNTAEENVVSNELLTDSKVRYTLYVNRLA